MEEVSCEIFKWIYVWYSLYIYISHILLMNSNQSEEIAAIRWKIGTLSHFFLRCEIYMFHTFWGRFLRFFVCLLPKWLLSAVRLWSWKLWAERWYPKRYPTRLQDSIGSSVTKFDSSSNLCLGFFLLKMISSSSPIGFFEWCRHSWLREEGFLISLMAGTFRCICSPAENVTNWEIFRRS